MKRALQRKSGILWRVSARRGWRFPDFSQEDTETEDSRRPLHCHFERKREIFSVCGDTILCQIVSNEKPSITQTFGHQLLDRDNQREMKRQYTSARRVFQPLLPEGADEQSKAGLAAPIRERRKRNTPMRRQTSGVLMSQGTKKGCEIIAPWTQKRTFDFCESKVLFRVRI